jgi:hypothetical protein
MGAPPLTEQENNMAKDANKTSAEMPDQTPDQETQERAEIYSGTLPENVKVKSGDPGTYAGEYDPAATQKKPEARKDLPKGYVPGGYAGGYKSSNSK